jgi:hypothetical protein
MMILRLTNYQVGISASPKHSSRISWKNGIYLSKDGRSKRIRKNKTKPLPLKIIYNRVVIGKNSASNSTRYLISGGVRLNFYYNLNELSGKSFWYFGRLAACTGGSYDFNSIGVITVEDESKKYDIPLHY